MRTIMSRTPYDGSFSFSRRHFNFNTWFLKKHDARQSDGDLEWDDEGPIFFAPAEPSDARPATTSSSSFPPATATKRRSAVSRLRSAFAAVLASSALRLVVSKKGLAANGGRVTGTLFGPRRGHVHLSFQPDPRSPPVLLLELSTPTSALVTEMASGLVRIALECDRKDDGQGGENRRKRRHLVDEPLWRAYCNGRKLGTAARRDPLEPDLEVLRKVGPVSMGAGVVVSGGDAAGEEDGSSTGKPKLEQIMYMRAGFERVVGSPDSMAFYMVGPEGVGAASGPELSIYLLRV